jgi:DNA-binding NtrC family response regulator
MAKDFASTLIGSSNRMQKLRADIRRYGPTGAKVRLEGESGTGKERVARALFEANGGKGPLVAVNCAAFAESLLESELFGHEQGAFTNATKRRIGKLEYADGGTLFLDEVATMSVVMQVKLLRALEDGFPRVGGNEIVFPNFRLLSATLDDLVTRVEEGTFRLDLFYRINGPAIRVPPLRERIEDIPELVSHFLSCRLNRGQNTLSVTQRALDRLASHDWPGNVRELRSVVETAHAICGGVIDEEHIYITRLAIGSSTCNCTCQPATAFAPMTLAEKVDEYILLTVEHMGSIAAAARMLGVDRATVRRHLPETPKRQRPGRQPPKKRPADI